ncbi:MAG: hypothetical protein ACREDZ_16000, partial [Kiloniellales bacterium]
MTRRTAIQVYGFASGMLDDTLAARSDIRAYYSGALEIANLLGLPQGGLALRGGLAFVAELAQAADGCRLARFEFSTEQVYLIAFTDLEIRVYREGVLQATLASPYAAADLAGLDWTQSLDTMILVHPQHAPRRLLRQGSHSAWALSTLALTNPPKHEFGLSYPALAITPGAVSGSGVTLAADAPWFEANDLQATVSGNGGIAKVTA